MLIIIHEAEGGQRPLQNLGDVIDVQPIAVGALLILSMVLVLLVLLVLLMLSILLVL